MLASRRSRACAAAMAVAVLVLAAAGANADGAGTRGASSHILIGAAPEHDFTVLADGEPAPDSPVTSDELGIVEFSLDLPAGTHTVSLSPSGAIPDPPVISNVRAEEITSTSAVIRWETDVPTNGRVVYGTTPEYGGDSGVIPVYTTSHAVLLTGLEPGTLHHYRVQGADTIGQTVWSGDETFNTEPEPLEVSDVEVSMLGPTWAVVEWNTNRLSTSQVEYGITDSYGEETPEDEDPVLGHTVMLTGLLEGTEYHFRVVSRDSFGMLARSSDHVFTTHEVEPTGPPVIDDVTFVVESLTSVTITWTTDREATSCVRYGTKGVLDHCTEVDTTGVTDHRVRVRPVAPDHEYTFAVLSACGADTAESAGHTFMAESPVGINLSGKGVTILKPGAVCVTDTAATIAWTTDRACTTWVEYGDDDNWDSPAFPERGRGECHEALLTGLTPGTLYHFRVSAWDECGGRVDLDGGTFETCVYPDLTPPSIPEELVALPCEEGVELSWSACPDDDLAGYYVYRAALGREGDQGGDKEGDPGRVVRLNELPVTTESFLDENVEEHVLYRYLVSAVDDAGNEGHACEPVSVLIDPSGEEGASGLHLAVGLNPCYGSTTIDYAVPPGVRPRVRIYSVGGRLVRELSAEPSEKGVGTLEWNCRDGVNRPVGTGVFVCELISGSDVLREKLTVIR